MAALLLGLVILTACAGNRGNFAGYQDRYDSGQTPLYGVTPYDPLTVSFVALLMATVGTLACWIPAGRAARVEPATALRAD